MACIENTNQIGAALIALRGRFNADTPTGHRCSNLEQAFANLPPEGIPYLTRDSIRDQRARLLKSIREQMNDLTRLTSS